MIAAFYRMPELEPVLRVVAFLFPLDGLNTVAKSLLTRELRFRLYIALDVSAYVLGYALVGVVLAWYGYGVWALVSANLAQVAVRTVAMYLATRHSVLPSVNLRAARDLLSFGFGHSMAQIGTLLSQQGDNLVVGRWLGAAALGVYGRAYNLMVMPASAFGRIINRVLFPVMSQVQDERDRLANAYERGLAVVAFIALPLSTVLWVVAPEFIAVVLGPAWGDVVLPFRLFSISLLFRMSSKINVEPHPELVEQLPSPKVVWVMVPAGAPTQQTVAELGELLGDGDVVVDGGNSRWTDDEKHAAELAEKNIGFVDCGVSGGVWGLDNGYALMAGGDADDIAKVQPAFDALRPDESTGFVHSGRVGAGHFSKMVHNGIEYAMMQAYAEGFELLEKVDIVDDVTAVFDSWRTGTVVRSWLLDLLVNALQDDPGLSKIRGYAEDSGEGRWTVEAAIDHAVPMNTIAAALFARFASRQEESPAMQAVAAMRRQFGGHAVQAAEEVGLVAADPDPSDPV